MKKPEKLCDLIRSRILRGILPHDSDARIFTGAGDGQACACCDEPVGRHDVQIDVEHSSHASNPVVAMHRVCFQYWSSIADELSAPEPVRLSRRQGSAEDQQQRLE
jgi:hypothetical protein